MREIKFRAWNPLANAFRPVSLLDMENMIKDMEWKQNCLWLRNTERSIYEQFTGLHDKNGREVYEGDVLLCESNFNGFYVCVINYNEKEARYALTKYGGSKDRDYRDSNIHGCYPFGFSGSSINCPSRIEIIGNIHENSELLNPTKDGLCNKQP